MAAALASPHLGTFIGCQCWPSVICCPSRLSPPFVVPICWPSPCSHWSVLIIHPLCRLCSAPSSHSIPSHHPWPCPAGPVIPSFPPLWQLGCCCAGSHRCQSSSPPLTIVSLPRHWSSSPPLAIVSIPCWLLASTIHPASSGSQGWGWVLGRPLFIICCSSLSSFFCHCIVVSPLSTLQAGACSGGIG